MDSLKTTGAWAQRARTARALGCALACLVPAAARADADGAPAAAPELRRELAGHNFIPSLYTTDPFVSTYVGSETGFGYGTAAGHTFNINGQPVTVAQSQIGAFAQILSFQYGFVDWWAVRLSTSIIAYSGVNSTGVVNIGTNFIGSANLGTTVSFKVGDNLRLGGAFDAKFGPSVFFNILSAVQESINNGGGDIVSPITSTGSLQLVPAFVGAWAINPWVGMTFNLTYNYLTTTANTSAGSTTEAGSFLSPNVIFDFNLHPVGVDLGFLLGFQTMTSIGNTFNFRQYRWQTGIYYTGVRALNVGMEIVYQRAPVVGNTESFITAVEVLLTMQYNFN